MSMTESIIPTVSPPVGMGQISLIRRPEVARSVVGSCIGLALYHRRCGIGVFGHIVLPEAAGRSGLPGKYADTAIPHMLELLQAEGAHSAGLVAKLAGGANMFGSTGPLQVGNTNIEAVIQLMQKHGIPIGGQSVGGSKGRRLSFNSENGDLTVEVVGENPITL